EPIEYLDVETTGLEQTGYGPETKYSDSVTAVTASRVTASPAGCKSLHSAQLGARCKMPPLRLIDFLLKLIWQRDLSVEYRVCMLEVDFLRRRGYSARQGDRASIGDAVSSLLGDLVLEATA